MTNLLENERLDDLEINGLKLIQNKNGYCFTSDSVLVANSVAARKTSKVLDIGTGSGIIAILLAGKLEMQNVTAIEIQDELYDIAKRNVNMNNLCDKVDVLHVSLQDYAKSESAESYDVIVTNPPYKKPTAGEMDKDEVRQKCKYEITLTLQELIKCSARLLKFGGKFYMVHRADRMAECIYELKLNKVEPKVMTLVYPKASKCPDTVIFECIKGAGAGLKINSLVVYDENGEMTQEARKLYSKE